MTEEAGATKQAQTHNASTPDHGYVIVSGTSLIELGDSVGG